MSSYYRKLDDLKRQALHLYIFRFFTFSYSEPEFSQDDCSFSNTQTMLKRVIFHLQIAYIFLKFLKINKSFVGLWRKLQSQSRIEA
jgi:hypothetical protein